MKTNICLILIIAVCFVACSPAKRLAKFKRVHPELFERQIIIDTVLIEGGTRVDTVIQLNTDTTALDSILEQLRSVWGDSVTNTVITEIRRVYVAKKFLTDTIIREIDGITLVLWQSGRDLGIRIEEDDRRIIRRVMYDCPKLILTRWQSFFIMSGKIGWILLLVGIIIGYLWHR